MGLAPGVRLGAYQVTDQIGAGGMGEVWRATDTGLGRQVAIKVLPDAYAHDPERLARFEREARTVASLNHPHIATVYGLERANGVPAIVMELLDGDTLAERIAVGPVPPDEALTIARQIAEALDAAHAHGIIHRDLKPANVQVRPDGTVKVLDFGLAKLLDPITGPESSATSTVTSPAATRAGIILGTAAYMSPEQALGRMADKRSDIWAFGVVLYEMLTGTRPFDGATVTAVISEVLKSEPDFTRLPADTSDGIRRLLRHCLQKDPAERLHDIADARIWIDDARQVTQAEAAAPLPGRRWRDRWGVLSALAVMTAIAVVQTVRLSQQSSIGPFAPESRLEIATPALPPGAPVADVGDLPKIAWAEISPDGSKVVYSAFRDDRLLLWVRALDTVMARPLPGTEAAVWPFWSPDSRSLGFFADGHLKRVDIDGGTVRTLTSAPFGTGGAWNADGTILYSPLFSGPIYRIDAAGGEPTVVTHVADRQQGHKHPRFLPDGRRFLYVAQGDPRTGGIYLGDLGESQPRRLLDAEFAAVHVPSNELLFIQQGTLFSQHFDLRSASLSGNPSPVAEHVVGLSASPAGPILYRAAPEEGRRQLTWFDRSGNEIGRLAVPLTGRTEDVELSPDGKHAALTRSVDGNVDIWLVETARGVLTRFTSDPGFDGSLRWSPDGRRVVFTSARRGQVFRLYTKPAGGTGEDEVLLSTAQNTSPVDWSPDGRFLLFRSVDPVTSHDLWVLPLDGDRQPFPVVRTNFVEAFGQFSPDGKWIAYQSNESGRHEVYVQPFPGPGPKVQISTNGGGQVRWRVDGREMFYLGLDSRMMAVPIRRTSEGRALEPGTPVPLFTARVGGIVPLQSGYNLAYDVSRDGQRFLMSTVVREAALAPITIVLNWRPAR